MARNDRRFMAELLERVVTQIPTSLALFRPAPKSESLEIMALSHVRVVASPLDLLNLA
jgi:hypothetical protein